MKDGEGIGWRWRVNECEGCKRNRKKVKNVGMRSMGKEQEEGEEWRNVNDGEGVGKGKSEGMRQYVKKLEEGEEWRNDGEGIGRRYRVKECKGCRRNRKTVKNVGMRRMENE